MSKPAVVYGGLLLLAVVGFVFAQVMYPGREDGLAKPDDFIVLAHRGMHTNWDKASYDRATGCEASHIYQPTHEYIESIVASIEAAFSAGANMVEIDIRPSADSVLMLNHEEDLECKTDGHGKIYEHSVDELRTFDVGYGFTADGGHSYPLR